MLLGAVALLSACGGDLAPEPPRVGTVTLQSVPVLRIGEKAALRIDVLDTAGDPMSVPIEAVTFSVVDGGDILRITNSEAEAISVGQAFVTASVGGKVSAAVSVRVILRRYTVTDLGSLAGGYTRAMAINGLGQVVGYSTLADGTQRAFLWTPQHPNSTEGTMQDLGVLPGFVSSSASDLNDAGQATGNLTPASGHSGRGFLWQSGVMQIIDGPVGSSYVYAKAINASAQVLILSNGSPYLWDAGTLTSCRGPMSDVIYGVADLNDAGTAVGIYTIGPGAGTQYGWMFAGGVFSGGTLALPVAINNLGEVLTYYQDAPQVRMLSALNDVGQSVGADASGALLVEAGVTHALNDMLDSGSRWHLDGALATNNSGQIVSYDGSSALLLTPQP